MLDSLDIIFSVYLVMSLLVSLNISPTIAMCLEQMVFIKRDFIAKFHPEVKTSSPIFSTIYSNASYILVSPFCVYQKIHLVSLYILSLSQEMQSYLHELDLLDFRIKVRKMELVSIYS